jgi:hypothetical protein
MRKTYLLVLIGLFFFANNLNARQVKGTIIFENDTLNTMLKIPVYGIAGPPNYLKIQYKIKYYDENQAIKTLRPENAKEVRFTFKGEKIRMLSKSNANGIGGFSLTSSTGIFLKVVELEVEGQVKLFNVYITEVGPAVIIGTGGASPGSSANMSKKYVLEKTNGKLFRVRSLSFKRDMMTYFSDCPTLVEKIKKKEFRMRDLKMIVEFYNDRCK